MYLTFTKKMYNTSIMDKYFKRFLTKHRTHLHMKPTAVRDRVNLIRNICIKRDQKRESRKQPFNPQPCAITNDAPPEPDLRSFPFNESSTFIHHCPQLAYHSGATLHPFSLFISFFCSFCSRTQTAAMWLTTFTTHLSLCMSS